MRRYSNLFQSTKSKNYQNKWNDAEKGPFFLPFVGDILIRIIHADYYNRINYEDRGRKKISKFTTNFQNIDNYRNLEGLNKNASFLTHLEKK